MGLEIAGTEELDASMPGLKKLDGRPSAEVWKQLPENVRASISSSLKDAKGSYNEYSRDSGAKDAVSLAARVVGEAVTSGNAGTSLRVIVKTPKLKVVGK